MLQITSSCTSSCTCFHLLAAPPRRRAPTWWGHEGREASVGGCGDGWGIGVRIRILKAHLVFTPASPHFVYNSLILARACGWCRLWVVLPQLYNVSLAVDHALNTCQQVGRSPPALHREEELERMVNQVKEVGQRPPQIMTRSQPLNELK